jgi:hypothetical protein
MMRRGLDFGRNAGAADIAERAADLAEHLPDGLRPLASVAYNYRWSWLPGGEALFREINPHRWELAGGNPVKFLSDLWHDSRPRRGDTALKAACARLRSTSQWISPAARTPPVDTWPRCLHVPSGIRIAAHLLGGWAC